MKKLFLLALISLTTTAFAQHVAPLSIQVTEIKLDSLRDAYLAQPTMYRASLEVVAEQLDQNEQEIKAAKSELKVEQAHAKDITKSIKDGLKRIASLKKLYAKEKTEIDVMLKTLENQQKKIGKMTELNNETRDAYIQMLISQQQSLEQSVREIEERTKAIMQIEEMLQNAQLGCQTFEQEIEKKSFDLAQIEALYKARRDMLKAEQKSAKSIQWHYGSYQPVRAE